MPPCTCSVERPTKYQKEHSHGIARAYYIKKHSGTAIRWLLSPVDCQNRPSRASQHTEQLHGHRCSPLLPFTLYMIVAWRVPANTSTLTSSSSPGCQSICNTIDRPRDTYLYIPQNRVTPLSSPPSHEGSPPPQVSGEETPLVRDSDKSRATSVGQSHGATRTGHIVGDSLYRSIGSKPTCTRPISEPFYFYFLSIDRPRIDFSISPGIQA